MPRSWRSALAVFGITTVIAVAATTRHHSQMIEQGQPPSYLTWPHAMVQEMPFFYLWALAVPLVLWFVRRVARRGLPAAGGVAVHVAFAAAVILLQGFVLTGLFALTPSAARASLWHRAEMVLTDTFTRLPTLLVTYGAVLATVLAYDYYRRLVDRELSTAAMATELAEARLSALRAQLHPHFVFNALNTVAMLVRGQRNAEAVDTIAGLSDLLRDALDDGEQPDATLEQELSFARRYLAIEQIRFGDRLHVTIDVPADLAQVRVPRLLLQPLVENAVRHGVGRRAAAGRVVVRAARRADRLVIQVQDDGPGPGSGGGTVAGHGVGLANTRSRLETLFGNAAAVTLEPAPGGGALATVTLPWRDAAA